MTRTRTVTAVWAAALVAAATALADSGLPRIAYTPADQAAARATVLRRSDFGSGWTGGRVKPQLSPAPKCGGYHPKQSDLVLTGVAASQYRTATGLEFMSQVQVLHTARMVRLDWQRSVVAPGAVACLRSSIAKSLGSRARLVSFAKVGFPRVGTYTAAYRAVVDVAVPVGGKVRVVVELVAVGRSRSEITLTSACPASARAAMARAERTLASKLLRRARA
jgi:hypothetical protein